MNSDSYRLVSDKANAAGSGEETLRLIAKLPAPEGLEDRVNSGLKSAPRTGRILEWPAMLHPAGGWMPGGWIRGAAAAAIVFVVAGGGWGIYTRVQPNQPAKVIMMPRAGAGGGFSSAGAMRTPQTLNLPVVVEPAIVQTSNAQTVSTQPLQAKHGKKAPAKVVPMRHSKVKVNSGKETTAQPAVSAAK
jgi:hypothetical protein